MADSENQVRLADYPQLRLIAWSIPHCECIEEEQAFGIYRANWRFVETESLGKEEKALVARLVRRFAGGKPVYGGWPDYSEITGFDGIIAEVEPGYRRVIKPHETTGIFFLDDDLRQTLYTRLRDLWTHTSTALEGNRLTLEEVSRVLGGVGGPAAAYGLPPKDCREALGHAKAVDTVFNLLNSLDKGEPVTEQHLFGLHRAIQTETVTDTCSPTGAWKREPNGAWASVGGRRTFIEFADPRDVPGLMANWLAMLNGFLAKPPFKHDDALAAYACLHVSFVRIHPFFDGNGRMVRLLANLPAIKAGLPPVLIDPVRRSEYLDCLSAFHLEEQQDAGASLLPQPSEKLAGFQWFCGECWQSSLDLAAGMRRIQKARDRGLNGDSAP